MRGRKRAVIGLFLMLPAGKAQAGYGAELLAPLLAIGGTCIVGSTTAGVLLTANGGNPSPESLIFVGATLAAVLLGATSENIHKELVLQVKADHDTYLAGGEMTPFLQSVYREVRLRSHELQLKDGPCVAGEIDELKMTEAIDRMVAMAGNP